MIESSPRAVRRAADTRSMRAFPKPGLWRSSRIHSVGSKQSRFHLARTRRCISFETWKDSSGTGSPDHRSFRGYRVCRSAARQTLRREVVGVCSGPNVELVRALGADSVIDYTREDFTKSGNTYDLIFDVVGATTFDRCQRSLKPNGVFLQNIMELSDIVRVLWTSITGGKKIKGGVAIGNMANICVSSRHLPRLGRSGRSSTEAIRWSGSRKHSSMLSKDTRRETS